MVTSRSSRPSPARGALAALSRVVVLVVAISLMLGACASTPESRARYDIWDIYYTTARECERQFTGWHVVNVKMDGGVDLRGHISVGVTEFVTCYWDGIKARVERRRADGLPVPETTNLQPEVDIDLDV
jgi:hypothetical protein